MIINIVPIGNSKGIRIPKSVLDQCSIESEVDLEVKDGKIILEPINKNPRSGWDKAFKQMAEQKDDSLLVADSIGLDADDWEW